MYGLLGHFYTKINRHNKTTISKKHKEIDIMNQITEKERNAIYLVRATANARELSDYEKALIIMTCGVIRLDTDAGVYRVRKFFGKFYAV